MVSDNPIVNSILTSRFFYALDYSDFPSPPFSSWELHALKVLKNQVDNAQSILEFASNGGFLNSNFSQFNHQRWMHTRNKKALELIAKGFSALKEVDRVIDYCELNDKRLIPLLRTARQQFELALEADNSNTHARYWLSKLHFKYHVPGANKAVGAALLVEAAEMGDPDALYELGCRLRVENDYVQSDQQAFYFIEKAVDQLHPGALYLLGAVYLTGDCVNQDVSSAIWCFHRASEKGHAGAAIAYGSLLLRGVEVPESITRFNRKNRKSRKLDESNNPLELARQQFEIAAKAGNELGFKWLRRLEEEERRLLDS